MKHVTVKTKDVTRFIQAVDDLLYRPESTEGMGVLWGPPGTGKTTALAYIVNIYDGIYIRAMTCSSITSILGDLCRAVGEERRLRKSDMVELIVNKLCKGDNGAPPPTPRPIFIDEADYLFRNFELVDILRDIYDTSGCPVIMVGMEDIARKIREHGRFARRITQWIEFKGLDLEDTAQVAMECCEVEIAECLLQHLHRETAGNIGRVIIGLSKIEGYAKMNRKNRITAKEWDNKPLYFDQPVFSKRTNGK
jgi:DNA transposition AAA+ family ATPase